MRKLLAASAAIGLIMFVVPESTAAAGPLTKEASTSRPTAYVVSSNDGTVVPVDLATRKAGKPIALPEPGQHDGAGDIVITPNGKTVFVENGADEVQSVTPITTATNRAGPAIHASNYGNAAPMLAMSPNGRTLFVLGANVTAINTNTRTVERKIKFPHQGNGLGLYPTADGSTLYALSANTVTPISMVTDRAGLGTALPFGAFGLAITPDGKTAYASDWNSGQVVPITTATGTLGSPIKVGRLPAQIVVTPNGKTAYVDNAGSDSVTPIDITTNQPEPAIKVPVVYLEDGASSLTLTPNGKTLLVFGLHTVTLINTKTNKASKPIKVNGPAAAALTANGETAWVVAQGSNALVSINLATGSVSKPIKAGNDPIALALKPCQS